MIIAKITTNSREKLKVLKSLWNLIVNGKQSVYKVYVKNVREYRRFLQIAKLYGLSLNKRYGVYMRKGSSTGGIRVKFTNEPPVVIKDGNKKYVNTNKVRFLIFNIMAVHTCPCRTDLCELNCYAKRDARNLSVVASWINAYLWSLRPEFVDVYTKYIKAYRNKHNDKKVVVRIHGSGDFYSKTYLKKWFMISDNCKSIPGLKFTAYTKSIKYIDSKDDIPFNMVIRYSIWDDTNLDDIAKCIKLGLSTYSAVDDLKEVRPGQRCKCKSCGDCYKCFVERVKDIYCEKH